MTHLTSFAQNLANSIRDGQELKRLEQLFHQYPNSSFETGLSYTQAKSLGFEVQQTYQGTMVSLPPARGTSQFGDH